MTDIWDSYNFSDNNKETEERIKMEKKKLNNKFLLVVKSIVKEMVGTSKLIDINIRDRRSERVIQVIFNNSMTDSCFVVTDDSFILYGTQGSRKHNDEPGDRYSISDMSVFDSVVRQNIEQCLIPYIKESYKKGWAKSLPSKIKEEKVEFNFSEFTEEWLIDKFHDITEGIMNGETIENVKIQTAMKTAMVTFDVDCGRYGLHRGCGLSINRNCYVEVDLYDTPLEGCGVESELSEEIEKLIKQ